MGAAVPHPAGYKLKFTENPPHSGWNFGRWLLILSVLSCLNLLY